MTNTLKGLVKIIKEVKELGDSLSVQGLEPMLYFDDIYIMVNNFEALKQCKTYFINLPDFGKCDFYSNRLDVYYKNGRRALTIWIK